MEKQIFSTVIARKINRFQAFIGHLQVGNFAGARNVFLYLYLKFTDMFPRLTSMTAWAKITVDELLVVVMFFSVVVYTFLPLQSKDSFKICIHASETSYHT